MTKILLVEDDKSLREIYGVRLLAEGYDIISAGDGEEALAMAIKERPDLIVSDVMMPKISGFDMLDILRSTTETKGIKVIMMTALSSEDQRSRGESLGADRYLVKSQVGIEDVVRTVHEVLGDAPVTNNSYAQQPATPQPSAPQPTTAPGMRPAPTGVPARPEATPAPQQQPAPASYQAPAAPQQPQQQPPQPQPQSAPEPANSLPQPTAPFSTNRPASLGDRVIHPISPDTAKPDISSLMDKELMDDSADREQAPMAMPSPTPAPMQQPNDQSAPAAHGAIPHNPPAQPAAAQGGGASDIQFEETPRQDPPAPTANQ